MMTLLSSLVLGQSRKELESKRLEIIKTIEKTNKNLESTKKEKVQNMEKLKKLEQQINERQKLIQNLKYDVGMQEQRLKSNSKRLDSLGSKQSTLKGQYSQMLRMNYLKKMSNSKWSYLLSARNVNNLMLRWIYLSQLEEYTKRKLETISSVSREIQTNNIEIKKIQENKSTLAYKTEENLKKLAGEQIEKDELVKKLGLKEKTLSAELKKKQKEREKLNASIEKIITEELAKVNERSKKDSKEAKSVETDNAGFSNNKGGLSWPVNNAVVSGRFGTQPHPTVKNVSISNSGVDFTIQGKGVIKSVFEGEVIGYKEIPGYKKMVIVQHGSYFTVYSKLDDVLVDKGDKVSKGSILGYSHAEENGKSQLHFELWKDKNKQDPESWLVRK
ncbi:MAG: peptidoglycan DD-metalloendopeptidase family protein [Saprospiraceae bacterium]